MFAAKSRLAKIAASEKRMTRTRRAIVRSRWRVWTAVTCVAVVAIALAPVYPRAEEGLPTLIWMTWAQRRRKALNW